MPNNIEIRSEEVQEILGKPPRLIIRVGISVVFVLVVVLLVGSWFFKYPDIITASVNLTTQNPPATLNAMATGKISDLFYGENQNITKNSCVAIIENTANYKDVQNLKIILNDNTQQLSNENLQLGELQNYYSNYLRLLNNYQNFLKINYHASKVKAVKTQQNDYEKYGKLIRKKLNLQKQELELSKQQWEREKELFKKQVISNADYEKAQKLYLQQQAAYENVKSNLSSNEMQINNLESQLIDLNLQNSTEINQHKIQIQEAKNNLKAQIGQWEKRYLLISPINGKLTFTSVWSKNQFVNAGETVAVIVPDQKTRVIGKLTIPATGIGKVKKGQTVNIKFDNFPYMEFGLVKGIVKNISLVPITTENGVFYNAELSVPDTLISNYNIKIPFSQQMTGTAEIITEDISLLQRFFNPIKSLFKKNFE